eukprot:TRINITY_DN2155_c0_g5_i2.p1 TRINITY_DN2155_c0_g5~~TRINITY_DN2155_c0_g5_i2.p1  ORF type:complete len:411 (-),score=121.34 TRINITY_DN2155_c0_g5_i2:1117-2193(-)
MPNNRRVALTVFLDMILHEYQEAQQLHLHKLTMLFKRADTNRNGQLSLDEFSRLAMKIDPVLNEKRVAKMFHEATSRAGTGDVMTFSEFHEIMRMIGFLRKDVTVDPQSFSQMLMDEDQEQEAFALLRSHWNGLQRDVIALIVQFSKSGRYDDQRAAQELRELRYELEKELLSQTSVHRAVYNFRSLLSVAIRYFSDLFNETGELHLDQLDEELSALETGVLQQVRSCTALKDEDAPETSDIDSRSRTVSEESHNSRKDGESSSNAPSRSSSGDEPTTTTVTSTTASSSSSNTQGNTRNTLSGASNRSDTLAEEARSSFLDRFSPQSSVASTPQSSPKVTRSSRIQGSRNVGAKRTSD